MIKRIRAPIERALRDARLHPDQITHLVLAGGATRMPLFKRLAARLFQRLPIAQINPDEVVAHGAAVQAGLKMRDAALGRCRDDRCRAVQHGHPGLPVRRRADPGERPLSADHRAQYRDPDQPLDNRVLPAGQSAPAADPSLSRRGPPCRRQCRTGQADHSRTARPRPARSGVDIRFTYDVSGLLEVETAVLSTGAKDRLVIEGNPGILTAPEIAERLAKLAHLKIHPRDDARNQAVMAPRRTAL
ncbi:MAG: Hsp70 family protein [Aliidongia sp.]